MKRILFIAPHCYPIKSSESICNSKVAYSLAESGYKVDVFTCEDMSTYPADEEINQKFTSSDNLTIYTISKTNLVSRKSSFREILKSLFNYFYILLRTGYYCYGIDVQYKIIKEVEAQIKKQGISYDTMITRGFFTDFVGVYFSKKFGIKWIANWNDPFPANRFPYPYGEGYDAKLQYFQEKLLRKVQELAVLHTFPSERLRNYMLKCFPLISEEQTVVIPHMAHSLLKMSDAYNYKEKTLRIVHSGSVNSPRCPRLFLEALSTVNSSTNIDIECVFVGGYDDNINQMVKEYELEDVVKFIPPLPYAESLRYLSSANVSLIIEAICEEGIYLPTKMVDAIQTNLPVFCVSPSEGTLKDLVDNYNIGYAADNTDCNSIIDALHHLINDFIDDKLPIINKNSIPYFFEDSIVRQYANIL